MLPKNVHKLCCACLCAIGRDVTFWLLPTLLKGYFSSTLNVSGYLCIFPNHNNLCTSESVANPQQMPFGLSQGVQVSRPLMRRALDPVTNCLA